MGFIEGARFRSGVESGVASDPAGYGPAVYSGTANAGTPAGGTAGFGAGTIEAGGLVISTAGTKLYINTNTKASPTWTVVGSQS